MLCCRAAALTASVCISFAIHAMRVKRHEVRADIKQLGEAPIALRFIPGPLGIRMDATTGTVVTVYDGQSKDAGVTAGMIIRKLDGADYTTDLLREKKEGVDEYTILLERPNEQPLSNKPLGTAAAAAHYDSDHSLINDISGTATSASYAKQHLNEKLSRTTSPKSSTHHKELSFDMQVAQAVLALDRDASAPQDKKRRRGPHKKLSPDNSLSQWASITAQSMAKHGNWSADKGEHLESGSWGACEDKHLTEPVEQGSQSLGGQLGVKTIAEQRQRSPVVKPGEHPKPGKWSALEDEHLRKLVEEHKHTWNEIAAGLTGRNGPQCRQRWHNHLRPNLNKGSWTLEEDQKLWDGVQKLGRQFAQIETLYLPRRSHNDIRQRWESKVIWWRGTRPATPEPGVEANQN